MSRFFPALLAATIFMSFSGNVFAQANDVDCFKCIDTSDIAGEAITTYKIRPQAVTTSKLAKQAVTTNKLAGGAVSTSKIKNGAVTENKLSADLSNAMLGARLPRVLDGGDNLIGYLESVTQTRWHINVISGQGYIVHDLALHNGQVGPAPAVLYFVSNDCTGQAHIEFLAAGFVQTGYDATGVTNLYYAVKDSITQSVDYASKSAPGGCFVTNGNLQLAWPVLLNDPNVTGFASQASYSVPIEIEYTQ